MTDWMSKAVSADAAVACISSGASVFVTTDTARKRWAQIDLRPESKGPWSPYAIASLSNAATVALTSP